MEENPKMANVDEELVDEELMEDDSMEIESEEVMDENPRVAKADAQVQKLISQKISQQKMIKFTRW